MARWSQLPGAKLVLLGLAAAGCSTLAGVDFGAVHARDELADGGNPADDDGAIPEGSITPPGPQGCAADEKPCHGGCAKKDDALFGCGAPTCDACSLPFTTPVCRDGACAPGVCAPGHADCDGDPRTGCEADLASPSTCTSCTIKCVSAEVCAPTGCTTTCPSPTKACSGSCVDTATASNNCGACGNTCPTPANADPVCANSVCGITCHAGFDDCDSNQANGCEALGTFYQDTDNDGVGGGVSLRACTAPAGYKPASGDCDDGNPQVFPGQTAYFTTSYLKAGQPSFDYDCSGGETEDPSGYTHFTSCAGSCDDEGYLTASPLRSGTGIDNYCGSTRYKTCISNLAPLLISPQQLPQCTQDLGTAPAIPCR